MVYVLSHSHQAMYQSNVLGNVLAVKQVHSQEDGAHEDIQLRHCYGNAEFDMEAQNLSLCHFFKNILIMKSNKFFPGE